MSKYHNLRKNKVYTVKQGRRIYRGVYQSRFLNKAINKWTYVFKSLDSFTVYTPLADKCEVSDPFGR
jgi:hypothetical protein